MSSPDRPRRLHAVTRIILGAAVAALLAGALLCAAAGSAPAEGVKTRLDALAPDGVADDFPLERVAALQRRALGAGILCVGLAWLAWRARWWMDGGVRQAARAARNGGAEAAALLRETAPALAMVTAAGLALRLLYLSQPMRADEATTYLEFVSKPLLFGLSYYPAPNNHILHTVLAHGLTSLFGGEPWAIRLAALLAGTLMIPAAALAAAVVHGRAAALPAAGLAAVCWPWVFYSANARGYTLMGLLFLLLIPVCARLRQRRDDGAWIWFVLLAGLGLFTVPVMAYALVPLGVWIAVGRAPAGKELSVAAGATAVLTLLLYAPALIASGAAAAITPEMTPLARGAAWRGIADFAPALWRHWHTDVPAWAWAATLPLAACAWRSGGLALVSAAWFVVVLLAYPVMPYTRLWLWLSLPWMLLVAGGAGRLGAGRRWMLWTLVLALVAGQGWRIHASRSVLRSVETGVFWGAAEAADYLKGVWREGDDIEVDAPLSPLLYELERRGIRYEPRRGGRRWVMARTPPADAGEAAIRIGERGVYLRPARRE